MEIKAVLFDLDGTLLPMDMDVFIKAYFGGLAKKLAPLGYDPRSLVDSIMKGTTAMIRNDGSKSNEDAFWDTFNLAVGRDARRDEPHFASFYENEFQSVRDVCGFTPEAAGIVRRLRDANVPVVLATNPVFPAVATQSRARWAGLDPADFSLVTTYENIGYCKPNPRYYEEICRRIGVEPHECLMVGNDVSDDMVAATLGMKVFLLDDCLINAEGADVSHLPHGGFDALDRYLDGLFPS